MSHEERAKYAPLLTQLGCWDWSSLVRMALARMHAKHLEMTSDKSVLQQPAKTSDKKPARRKTVKVAAKTKKARKAG